MLERLKSVIRPNPMARFIRKHVRAGQCAIDIGANIGEISKILLECVGPGGSVHAFEPNPELVASHLSRIESPNYCVHTEAVSNAEGSATLYIDRREEMPAVASSLRVLDDLHASGKVQPVSVDTITLDTFVQKLGLRPDFIKIDVEGHEIDVFRGGVKTIAFFRPIIVFEFWETWWTRGVQNIFDFLAPQYSLLRVQDGTDAIEYYSKTSGTGVVDIACLPRSGSDLPALNSYRLGS
jgi:FkbM family methyltransferase